MTAHLESGAAGRVVVVHVPGPGVGGQPDGKLPRAKSGVSIETSARVIVEDEVVNTDESTQ